ncbi:MAG: chromosome segregation protein SMC [Elusimicrobia bacterium]|nr:chromosome segregation protein SMC [Elusimicrobiota bacterium]
MYLKSIELVGFKSFTDKTVLELRPGITGIVGPNGCGKSNVMEAARWCIGEMSWKSLRSPSMVDVIFAGNARRSPMGMAEVALTFDNVSRKLPLDFTEITVTRRIFRSGESEYFLNRTPCRLRDIRELFLDTGIGGDGYAIIDQGGVDFILNSKPEDRRSLFEEAAGVSKYRAKREEALRKLEKVEADLNRLQDSISLINDQIKKLDSDARKAKLYQKYQDELTAQEAAQALQEIKAVSAELEQKGAALAPVREKLDRRQVDLDGEEGRLAAARLQLTQEQSLAASVQQRIAGIRFEAGRLEERVRSGQALIEQLRSRQSEAREELDAALGRAHGLGPEMDAAKAAREKAGESLDSARRAREKFQSRCAEFDARLEEARRRMEDAKSQALAAMEAAVDASNRLAEQQGRARDLQIELRQISKEHGRAETQVRAARQDLQSAYADLLRQQAWLEGARKVAQDRQARRDGVAAELSRLSAQTVQLHVECEGSRARVEALEAQGEQDPYWIGAQAITASEAPGIFGTLRSLLQVEEGFETAVEDVLGERLHAVVCEDLAAAKAGIEFLEASGRGRARFLVLSALPDAPAAAADFPPQAKPLLEHVRWDPRVAGAMRHLLEECYALQRQVFGRYWVCGGAAVSETSTLLRADMGPLRRRIGEFEARQTELKAAHAVLEEQRAVLETEIRAALSVAREESERWSALAGRRNQAEERLNTLEAEIELNSLETRRFETEIASVDAEGERLRRSLEQSRARETETKNLEAVAAERLNAAEVEAAKNQVRREQLDQSVQHWETQYRLFEKQFQGLAVQEEQSKAQAEKRRAEIAGLDARVEEILNGETQARASLDQFHRDLAEQEKSSQAMQTRLQELLLSVESLEEAIEAIGGECQGYRDELHQWEVQASALESRRESLRGRLWDGWQLTIEEAGAKYGAAAVDADKIQSLRKRIQGMGNINLAAPEEYEALTSKHQFLLNQVADLQKAKEDLRAAITKINATTREHFRQTFTEVRDHFRRIYASLFEGGEADLLLSDPENLLETGVEIVAQPPGKRLQSITLLSGGERTMTAIALLFSFFMVKPSPVCMLDEADAALDEANVTRFVTMLREFAASSQFLIVSHNKRTMEAADVIYGITMEESGVSQVLAVDFKKKSAAPGPGPELAAEPDAGR